MLRFLNRRVVAFWTIQALVLLVSATAFTCAYLQLDVAGERLPHWVALCLVLVAWFMYANKHMDAYVQS